MKTTRRFTARLDEPLHVRFDVDERLASLSDANKVKGMFFASAMKRLGAGFEAVRPSLAEPPRFGSYIPFANYSQRDYGRVLIATARKAYPDKPLSEGIRLLGRDSFSTFATSRVGRFFVSVSAEPIELLEKIPSVLSAIANNLQVTFERPGDNHAVIRAKGNSGWSDCTYLGILEGLLLHYGKEPLIEVEVSEDLAASFDLRW